MLGVLTSLVAAEPFDLLEACGVPQRTGRMVPRLTPFGVYESADGYLAICAPTDQFARGVFAAIGRPELEHDPRFATRDARVANKDAINGYIETFTRSRPTAELVPLFERHGVPAAPVRTPADAVRDPRVLARGETVPLEHPDVRARRRPDRARGCRFAFRAPPAGAARPAPAVGQDNALVYGDWLGYERRHARAAARGRQHLRRTMSASAIDELRAAFEEPFRGARPRSPRGTAGRS